MEPDGKSQQQNSELDISENINTSDNVNTDNNVNTSENVNTDENITGDSEIRKIVRESKFPMEKERAFYSSDYKEKLKVFLDAYRLLQHLLNCVEDLPGEISEYERTLKYAYDQGSELHFEITKNIKYGRDDIEHRIFNLIKRYEYDINALVDYLYSMSKVEKTYDPSESAGYF